MTATSATIYYAGDVAGSQPYDPTKRNLLVSYFDGAQFPYAWRY